MGSTSQASGRHRSASREQLERERMKPLRAPMVIAVAAHILGYAGMWLTGESCHDPQVKRALGLKPDDFISGWLYLGTPSAPPAPASRPASADALHHWDGPAT